MSAAGSGFGSDAVMGFNSSSVQDFPAIEVVSKVGGNGQSRFVLVKQSPGTYLDFTCKGEGGASGQVCRWGDYSGPAPTSSQASRAPRGRSGFQGSGTGPAQATRAFPGERGTGGHSLGTARGSTPGLGQYYGYLIHAGSH